MTGPCFRLVVLAKDDSVRDLPFDNDFVGPGVVEVVSTARSWDTVRESAERFMVAIHKDYGASVRVTCLTPNDRVPPFYMDPEGRFHEGCPE